MPFSDVVRKELSIEAGGYCSNPVCRATTGVFLPGRAKSAGDGAHIVAESPTGPRGVSPLTPQERAMADNGVWLCPTCHRKVDIVQPENYSIETLREWKASAQIWWQQNQGRPLQTVAWPNTRPQVARPGAESLLGARRFWQAHQPLVRLLSNLRWQLPGAFEHDVPISNDVELQIRSLSSSPKGGRSWQDEWSTTFHCDDRELIDHMLQLVRCVDSLERPLGDILNGPRRVNFKQPDVLAEAIMRYLYVFDAFGKCLLGHENWGLSPKFDPGL